MFESIPYEHPLVLATGGGNDIVSATLVAFDLQRAGKVVDLAGMCSPGAYHSYAGSGSIQEASVNEILDCGQFMDGASRHIPALRPIPISFIDGKILELCKMQGLFVQVFNFSSRYGTDALVSSVEDLIKRNSYDGIVGVDVGGDILARGKADPTILSPLMDFTALYLLGHLSVPTTLVEFGLQTDGELRPQGCKEILSELSQNGQLRSFEIDPTDKAVEVYKKVYEGISGIRHGHTAYATLKTFSSDKDLQEPYRFKLHVKERKWNQEFEVLLEQRYFRKAFIFNPIYLSLTRPLCFSYRTPLEQCLRSKLVVDTRNELELMYTWHENICAWVGLVTPQIPEEMRKQILTHGLEGLQDHAHVAILWNKDREQIPAGTYRLAVGPFLVAGSSLTQLSTMGSHIEALLSKNLPSQ